MNDTDNELAGYNELDGLTIALCITFAALGFCGGVIYAALNVCGK